MKTTGDFGRYYCFDHEEDFETRDEALKHMVNVHGTPRVMANKRLDMIDEQYENIEEYEDELDEYDEDTEVV